MTALFFPRLAVLGPETNWLNPPLLVEVSVPSQEKVVMYRYMWIKVIDFTFCSTISLCVLLFIASNYLFGMSKPLLCSCTPSSLFCFNLLSVSNNEKLYILLCIAINSFLQFLSITCRRFHLIFFFFFFCFWRLFNLLLQTSPLSKTVPGARYSRNA